MTQTFEQLIPKASGELIRSKDWNDLVQDTKDITSKHTQDINAANQRVDALVAGVKQLNDAFTAYRAQVEEVISQFYRVGLTTTSSVYTIGQLAEIVVQVGDPRGGPLVGPNDAGRPWADFVTTWGQLKPSPGFESIAGDGDRSISVRTNEQGIARVLLKSDHAEGFSDLEENAVAASLATKQPASNKALSQLIIEAETPLAAKNAGAFKAISQEYERTDSTIMRRYTDTYFVKNSPQISKYIPMRPTWRDYRAVVLAFARSDGNPAAPGQRRGSDSILVTFRDWIGPWLNLEYLNDAELLNLVPDTRTKFASKVTSSYTDTSRLLSTEVEQMVVDDGLVGKMRKYRVIDQALDGLTVSNAPDFLPRLTQDLQHGVRIQHTLEHAQAGALGLSEPAVAFKVFTEAATRADTNVSGVTDQLNVLQRQIGQVNTRVDTVHDNVTSLQTAVTSVSGRVEATLAEGGSLSLLSKDLNTVKGQVAGFQVLNPTEVSSKLTEVIGISNRLTAIVKKVG